MSIASSLLVTVCLSTMSKYHQEFKKEVASLQGRKKLLLHVCCGPCSVYPLILLDKYFDITIYYTNDNIYPNSEYQKRLGELERYLKMIEDEHYIKLVIPESHQDSFLKAISKYKDDKEGYRRCVKCYGMRMREAFKYASSHHFDYCTTVMSISNHKNANYINELGKKLEQEYGIKFLISDFKKDGGIDKNNELNSKLDLYHQSYCGCLYSYINNGKK